jgi:hypothetical protein
MAVIWGMAAGGLLPLIRRKRGRDDTLRQVRKTVPRGKYIYGKELWR